MNFNQITDQLYVGTCPLNQDDLAELAQIPIDSVINLQSDDDLAINKIDWFALKQEYANHTIRAFRFAMIDFDEDDIASRLPGAIDVVQHSIAAGDVVYLHCSAGRERSPTVAAGWLSWYGGKTTADALQTVCERRPVARPYTAMLTRLNRHHRR